MKQDDTKNNRGERAGKLSEAAPAVQAQKKTDKSANSDEKTKARKKGQKKSFWQLWKASSALKKFELILLAIVAFTGIPILATYVIGNWQTWRSFKVEHEPVIAFRRFAVSVDEKNKNLRYNVHMENMTNIEATDFVAECPPTLDNKLVGINETIPSSPAVIEGHSDITICSGTIPAKIFEDISLGKSVFQIYIHASYKGPYETHSYCTKHQYAPQFGGVFINMGQCDPSKPFPQ